MSGNDVYNTLTPETLGYIDEVVEPTEGFANGQLYFLESGVAVALKAITRVGLRAGAPCCGRRGQGQERV